MKVPPENEGRININLDEEAVGESPLEATVQEAVNSVEPSATAEAPAEVSAAVAEELARLQAEKEDLLGTLIRRQADFENYRKRVERERKEDVQRATALLVDALLPVLDAFERALGAHGDAGYEEYRKGFDLIYRQLLDGLARIGLERIEALGKPFDPHYHQAVERVESADHAEGTVLEELQHGYKLRDRVLRPTMVRVAVQPAEPTAPDPTTTTSIT